MPSSLPALRSCPPLLALVLTLAVPSLALASPWTLPQHELVISTDLSFSSADQEYLYEGSTLQDYPLRGHFRSTNLALSFRYGFTDAFEMEARPNFKQLSYDADPVILGLGPLASNETFTLPDARKGVIDFDASKFGAADMNLAARYNLYRGVVVVTPEVGAKIPLGYRAPEATFSELNPAESQFTVSDDATLGDGQVDVHAGLLLGTYIPLTRSFVRADGGFIHRFGAPGDQVYANAKVGQYALENLIFFAGVRWVETVIKGDAIGKTFVDTNPTQSALNYSFESVVVRDLFLDRDSSVVELGALIDLGKVEMQIGFEEVVAGRNFANLTSVNIGITTSFPDATRPEPLAPSPPEAEAVIVIPQGDGTVIVEEVAPAPPEEAQPQEEEAQPEELILPPPTPAPLP